MAVIKAKKKPVIKKGEGYVYNPKTFAKEHADPRFIEVEDPQELLRLVEPFEFRGRKFIVFDSETHPHFKHSHQVPPSVVRRWVGTGKKATPQDYPFCISICDGKKAYSIYDSVDNGFKKFKQLAPLFEDPTIEKIAHNTKFDMHQFANAGMKIKGRLHDTVVLAKLANENRFAFTLRRLAAKLEGGTEKFEFMVDNYKTINKVKDYRHIPRELLTQYANADVWNAYLVFIDEYARAEKSDLIPLYDQECEVMIPLYAMERYGMKVDADYEKPLKEELQRLTDEAEQALYDKAGRIFNVNSGKQLYDVLMEQGVKDSLIKKTDKGNPSLKAKELERLANVHGVDMVKRVLEYRKYSKLLGTYAIGIYDQHDAAGRVHGNINQTEATTGRMSITKPALQTLPKKDTRIRRAFIPSDEFEMWFLDLDQVEYRMFAHYAIIPSLIEAIKNDYDVHAATAATLNNLDLEELIEKVKSGDKWANDLRGAAKTFNFALIYGMGTDALASMLKVSKSEAANVKAKYFATIPEARTFINTVHQVIKVRGFVKNFYGRRRRLKSNDAYKAPNALIQGNAADYIKRQIIGIYKYLKYYNLKTRMVNIVHDEIVNEKHKDEPDVIGKIRYLLSDFDSYRCPITAGVDRGNPSWGEKTEVHDVDFDKPESFEFMNYDVYDGSVFDINKQEELCNG